MPQPMPKPGPIMGDHGLRGQSYGQDGRIMGGIDPRLAVFLQQMQGGGQTTQGPAQLRGDLRQGGGK